MGTHYDAIVIGARCAGSPTAMLLARTGYKVLMIDKASFPSDTISTHIIWPTGITLLKKWGLLDRLAATGAPRLHNTTFDLGPFALKGTPYYHGQDWWLAPRRTILDKLLVDAAIETGVEFRENCTLNELIWKDGTVTGIKFTEKSGKQENATGRIIIGADGKNSVVARMVKAETYNEVDSATCWYYTYYSNLSDPDLIFYSRPGTGFGMIPTHNGLTLVAAAMKAEKFKEYRSDIPGNFMRMISHSPAFAEKVMDAKQEEHFSGVGELPNFFRKPYGAGWALVGDAGYHRDPITAQGISNAFQSAEMLANALHATFTEKLSMEEALREYQQQRDELVMPVYGFTCDFARLDPPPPDRMQLMEAIHGNQSATDRFIGCITGTESIPEFFAPENIQHIMMQRV